MSIIIPPFLKPGDTVALTVSARFVEYDQIRSAIEYFETFGFKIRIDEELYRSRDQFGGSDMQRAELFNKLLADEEVKAIWCARGGYGSARMVDAIDFDLLKKNPKWIAGFSDVTVLLDHILKNCNMASLHSTMPVFMHNKSGADLEDVKYAIETFVAALSGKFTEMNFKENPSVNMKDCSGVVCGGNLSVLYSIMGSVSEPAYEGSILFIEDLDEYYYHIDRMILGLKRAGRLSKLKALLVGSFISMHDNPVPFGKTVNEIIIEHCSDYGYPIIFDVDAGHHLHNTCLPFGVNAQLMNGILTFAAL